MEKQRRTIQSWNQQLILLFILLSSSLFQFFSFCIINRISLFNNYGFIPRHTNCHMILGHLRLGKSLLSFLSVVSFFLFHNYGFRHRRFLNNTYSSIFICFHFSQLAADTSPIHLLFNMFTSATCAVFTRFSCGCLL